MLKRNPWPVILQVIPELDIGGAERTTVEMAEAVRVAGGRALVLSQGGSLEKELQEAGGELLHFPAKTKNPALLLGNAWRMARLIRDYNVSLVHARSRAPAWSALLAARRTGRPFVTTYHGIYQQKGRFKAWYNGVMARGDAVIANSHFTAATIRERHALPEDRLHVIPRGVDLDAFDPGQVSADRLLALRQQWGAASDERIILLPGRLSRWKGQHLLIEAMARLQAHGPLRGIKVILAGDDQGRAAYTETLRSLINECSLADTVCLAGHCRDMPAAFLSADVTVIPSLEAEAFGRVSIEAQAMGCPVIAADIGALPETLGVYDEASRGAAEAGEGVHAVDTGWLFRAGDGASLAHALRLALDTQEHRWGIGRQQSRNRVAACFSKRALQMQTLMVYDKLLGTQLARSFKVCAGL